MDASTKFDVIFSIIVRRSCFIGHHNFSLIIFLRLKAIISTANIIAAEYKVTPVILSIPSGPWFGGMNGFTMESEATEVVSAKSFAVIKKMKRDMKNLFDTVCSFGCLLDLCRYSLSTLITYCNICPCCHYTKIENSSNTNISKRRALFPTMSFTI